MANSGFPDTNVIDDVAGAIVDMALGEVQSRVDTLKKRSEEAQALQRVIGQTMRLRTESNKASATHALNAREVRTQLDANLGTLREQGVAVDRLEQHYRLLGNTARRSAQQSLGLQQIQTGWKALQASSSQVSGAIGMAKVPVKASADYQALIRGIAIQAGVANEPEESELGRQVITISRDTGMARNDVAGVLNQLVAAGMDLKQALQYTPVASKFVVGQGAAADDTAKIVSALRDQAGITEPQDMQKALESIAYQTQAGHFETGDMAKWLAELLPLLSQQGTTGLAAVNQIGAMLQVQTRSTGNADAAGAELKTWVSGIGATDTVSAYKAVGIDYRTELATQQQQGFSPLESSVALARQYIEKSSPETARQMAEGSARISQQADPEKARQMLRTLEQALLTGNAFADVQVKVALAGAAQNEQLYQQYKNGGANASGLLDQNLGERRETSSQKWKEAGDATDDAMRSIGDSLRPVTDVVADTVRQVAISVGALAEQSPRVVQGLAGVAVAALAVFKGIAAYRLGQGLLNFAKGTLGGKSKAQSEPEPGPPGKDTEKPARRGKGHDNEIPAARQPVQSPVDTARPQPVSPAGRFVTRFSGLGFSGNGAGLQSGSAPRPTTSSPGWREAGGKLLAAAGTVFLTEKVVSRNTRREEVKAVAEKEAETQAVDTTDISVKPVALPAALPSPDEVSAQSSSPLVVVDRLEGALTSLHSLRDTSPSAEKSGIDLFDVGFKSLAVTREVLEKNTAQGGDNPVSLGSVALDVLEGGLKVAGSVRGEPKDGEQDTFNPIDIGQKGIAAAREVMENRAQAGGGGKGSLALDLVEGGLRFAGKLRGEPKEGEEGGFDLVGTSLKVVDSLRESISSTSTDNRQADAATSDDSPVDNGSADAVQGQSAASDAASHTSGETASGVQRVFVVNLDGLKGGGAASSSSDASDSTQGPDNQRV
ncbi:phage tail tape measure protein, partial [Pseudomonas sp. 3A(2025)]